MCDNSLTRKHIKVLHVDDSAETRCMWMFASESASLLQLPPELERDRKDK